LYYKCPTEKKNEETLGSALERQGGREQEGGGRGKGKWNVRVEHSFLGRKDGEKGRRA
jgi:hypothetical protein